MCDKPKLSIVFLNYNRITETRYTINKLSRLLENRHDIEVIAIDNGSDDGTSDFLQTQTDWMRVVNMPDNM
ncbi:glycosyltransferase, partial [Thiotrichales bacterium HSG1]|nr:glycosyltransferase [Thiotrichales bacterium HSG1]